MDLYRQSLFLLWAGKVGQANLTGFFQVSNYQVPEVPSIQVPMAKDRRLELPAPHNTVDLVGTGDAVVEAIQPTGPKTTHNNPVVTIN